MELITQIFEFIEFPIWIKDEYNEIIFINKSFKMSFNIDLSLGDISNEVIKTIRNIEESTKNILTREDNISSSIILNNKRYKHITFSYPETPNKLVSMLLETSNDVEFEKISYEKDILRLAIDNIPELIFYKDKNLRYVGVNKECEKFYTDRGVLSVIGKTDLELPLDKNFIETCNKHDKIVIESKETLYVEECIHTENSDECNIFETVKTPIIKNDGSVWGLVGVVRDITEQKKLEKKLRYLSYTDRLTDLYNRAYFDKKIEEIIEKKNFPIGVIIGDVNGLKMVNDTIGHLEGDLLLKEMSKVLTKACPDKGMVFRWGGDEFVTVLPNSSESECRSIMSKVNELCNKQKYDNFKLSIAQGFSLYNEKDSIDEVLRESEDKVYRQKILDNKSVRMSMVSTLKQTLQNKNIETEDHTKRVGEYCIKVGKKLGLDEETIDTLALVARLHDIGKTGIPEDILLKPGKLTDDEYEIIKTHSEKGYRLALLMPELSHIARGILTHHERWDGKGYPLGLRGEEIPLIARIVSVVDAYDAMTNSSIYKKLVDKNLAIKELKSCSGKQFDPKIVNVFCEILIEES